jgi:hypothetical protein
VQHLHLFRLDLRCAGSAANARRVLPRNHSSMMSGELRNEIALAWLNPNLTPGSSSNASGVGTAMRTEFSTEAANCRETAKAYAGGAEEHFLLRVAQAFDELAAGETAAQAARSASPNAPDRHLAKPPSLSGFRGA